MNTQNQTGAASALAWISATAAEAQSRVDKARHALDLAIKNKENPPPSADGEDFDKSIRECMFVLSDAEERAQKWLKQLRDFDKAVPPDSRDTTERLSKDSVIKWAKMAVIYLRTGTEGFITELCGRVLECKNPAEVHELLATKLRENYAGAIDSANREGHLPPWFKDAIGEVLA